MLFILNFQNLKLFVSSYIYILDSFYMIDMLSLSIIFLFLFRFVIFFLHPIRKFLISNLNCIYELLDFMSLAQIFFSCFVTTLKTERKRVTINNSLKIIQGKYIFKIIIFLIFLIQYYQKYIYKGK